MSLILPKLKSNLIDYSILAKACEYYKGLGYVQVEVPWLVEPEHSIATTPDGQRGYAFVTDNDKYLVCSAEQGFVQLLAEGELISNCKYFAVSPCFRDEPETQIHSKEFMKLELFANFEKAYRGDAEIMAVQFMKDACRFMGMNGVPTLVVKQFKETSPEDARVNPLYDLYDYFHIELGSYGTRNVDTHHISYGTGLALPRFSLSQEESDGLSP